jgi:hypothetical protein
VDGVESGEALLRNPSKSKSHGEVFFLATVCDVIRRLRGKKCSEWEWELFVNDVKRKELKFIK